MAESPSHRFGQIIGEVLETAVEPLLRQFAKGHGLFLDRHGARTRTADSDPKGATPVRLSDGRCASDAPANTNTVQLA